MTIHNLEDKKPIDIMVPPKDAQIPQVDYGITFIGYHNYPDQPKSTITVQTDVVGLSEVVQSFEDFLKAMGFHYEGHLEIVDEEETEI